jgi:3-hydroxybutyryl-CoA dehydrogenase
MTPRFAFVTAGRQEEMRRVVRQWDAALPPDVLLICQCADTPLGEIATWLAHPQRLVGFDGLFFASGRAATLVPSPVLWVEARQDAESLIRSLGRLPVWISDSPGLILPRIVCTLVNEAAFAVLEGVADEETIDLAVKLGVNYPHGPVDWGRSLGFARVLAVVDHLHTEYGEERYRACVLLRRWARMEAIQ